MGRGPGALASWNQGAEAAGGRRGWSPGFCAARGHLGLGTLGTAAFPPPARSGSGCTEPAPGRGRHVWATAQMGTWAPGLEAGTVE